jgi:AraC-like DNA-binding protein
MVMSMDWMLHCRNVFQGVLGCTMCGDPECVSEVVRVLQAGLERPENPFERFVLRQSLLIHLERLGRAIDQQFHRRFSPEPCPAIAFTEREHDWLVGEQEIDAVLHNWADRYRDWFRRHHQLPPALLARRILESRFTESITLQELASLVGSSRTRLATQFTRCFGLPPGEFVIRRRLRAGLARLREHDSTVALASERAGYESSSRFSAAVRRYTGMTPAQIRAMPAADYAAARRTPGAGHHRA